MVKKDSSALEKKLKNTSEYLKKEVFKNNELKRELDKVKEERDKILKQLESLEKSKIGTLLQI